LFWVYNGCLAHWFKKQITKKKKQKKKKGKQKKKKKKKTSPLPPTWTDGPQVDQAHGPHERCPPPPRRQVQPRFDRLPRRPKQPACSPEKQQPSEKNKTWLFLGVPDARITF